MKFKILIKHKGAADKTAWWEDYDKSEVNSAADAEKWGCETIERFNNTALPGERLREFLKSELIGQGTLHHNWRNQNLVLLMIRGPVPFDVMKCGRCGITGRRYGLQESVTRDKQFNKDKF